ncbi:uncharacterized protein TNCT_653611 [Trichonephila clavata]|uniref:Uncharacterized protein n=1 Tax=Trichonephila clavata TaxID=2740835 RepID=A0A8X6GT48_TRICU|nr:uncharacterized protein TNCT_653611 [Trichonephila clavata]
MIPVLVRIHDTSSHPSYTVMVHHEIPRDFLVKYVLGCPVGTPIELQGCSSSDYFVVECLRTDGGFRFNLDFKTPLGIMAEDGRAFMCIYASEENGWSMTADAWLDMSNQKDDKRLRSPEHFSIVAYLQMERVQDPRTEGKRIFTSLMNLPPVSDTVSDNAARNIFLENMTTGNEKMDNDLVEENAGGAQSPGRVTFGR